MRDTFISALTGIAEQDERVVLITGDLGFKVFDNFRKKHADQFINAGIARTVYGRYRNWYGIRGLYRISLLHRQFHVHEMS